mmetsp:Transcript_21519/g.26618  ORF Transcript_21519/g.26618 Transcript_21519/m.26618 type:complete len:220 (+) Transcript_21519:345-1004(+)
MHSSPPPNPHSRSDTPTTPPPLARTIPWRDQRALWHFQTPPIPSRHTFVPCNNTLTHEIEAPAHLPRVKIHLHLPVRHRRPMGPVSWRRSFLRLVITHRINGQSLRAVSSSTFRSRPFAIRSPCLRSSSSIVTTFGTGCTDRANPPPSVSCSPQDRFVTPSIPYNPVLLPPKRHRTHSTTLQTPSHPMTYRYPSSTPTRSRSAATPCARTDFRWEPRNP